MKKVIFGLMVVGLLLVGANVFAAGDLIVNGKIGVGTTTPVTSLDVNGGIKIGNVTTACSASLNGVLRYSGTALEFCNGTAWQLLSSVSAPSSDSDTKLLLHMDGSNGSVAFTDGSLSAHPVTANGNAQISTSQSKFGGASGLFDGTGDYLSVADNADLEFGYSNFTIDFWFYPTNVTTRQALFHWSGGEDWSLGMDYNYQNAGKIDIYASSNGTSWNLLTADLGGGVMSVGTLSLTLNNWNHIALVRNGNNWMTFINGIKDIDVTASGTLIDKALPKVIGRWFSAAAMSQVIGYIDEFRVSKGIARWTSNFTPTTAPY